MTPAFLSDLLIVAGRVTPTVELDSRIDAELHVKDEVGPSELSTMSSSLRERILAPRLVLVIVIGVIGLAAGLPVG